MCIRDRALQEKVLAVLTSKLPDDDRKVQMARLNLAFTRLVLGDLEGAAALQDRAVQILSRSLPDDHPDLLAALGHLATRWHERGDFKRALMLRERVLE